MELSKYDRAVQLLNERRKTKGSWDYLNGQIANEVELRASALDLLDPLPVSKKSGQYDNSADDLDSKHECSGKPGCECYGCNSGGLSGGYRRL